MYNAQNYVRNKNMKVAAWDFYQLVLEGSRLLTSILDSIVHQIGVLRELGGLSNISNT